ncbi:MAG: HPP family protein [Gammaproteobacteria bacterium]|jgi:hypothetical protein
MQSLTGYLRRFAGIGATGSGHLEKWISGAGGLTGILGVLLISQAYLGLSGSASLVASMGASAVLLFAVPHGPLSQPWAVFGGHLISAAIGVGCARLHAPPLFTSALAVALAISAMHYLRCIHPPGGATALTAVAGGESVHAMGFQFVLTPVLLNVLVILLVAMLFNIPFPWRRYPVLWAQQRKRPLSPPGTSAAEDRSMAAASSGASRTIESGDRHPADIRAGRDYCNGAFGPDWQVRRIINSRHSDAGEIVSYRVVAGSKRRQTGSASREAFAGWARYEVRLNENSWQRVGTASRRAAPENPSCNRINRRDA